MTLEQKPAKGTSLTEALTVDRHASSAKFLRRLYRENSAQPRSPAGRGTNVPRSAKLVRPTEVSAKVQTTRPITHHDPGNCPRSASHTPRHRARPKRASREKPRGRATRSRTGRCIRPSRERTSRVRPRISSAKSSARPRRPTVNPSDPDRSDSATTRLSGRSSRTTVPTPRSTRSPF
ncbi:unnamed protein product [Microthlaspi erraticum]|uniref:Uncharacterized protein n=1 Tax=Microthlaspi erraticum TaxID=1685480 RepID=A0A6D2JEG7_9BRAS|nr:unnamed protein product [Microthlaspi erraticum]